MAVYLLRDGSFIAPDLNRERIYLNRWRVCFSFVRLVPPAVFCWWELWLIHLLGNRVWYMQPVWDGDRTLNSTFLRDLASGKIFFFPRKWSNGWYLHKISIGKHCQKLLGMCCAHPNTHMHIQAHRFVRVWFASTDGHIGVTAEKDPQNLDWETMLCCVTHGYKYMVFIYRSPTLETGTTCHSAALL